MKLLFWFCLATTIYAYFGYAAWLWLQARWRHRPILRSPIEPTVSVILAVHNEEANLPAKLENLFSLYYPREKLEIVVVSDGSSDGTERILRSYGGRINAVILEQARGKAYALNQAVQSASGEILFFQDVRQTVELNALRELVSCFVNQEIGAASGELNLTSDVLGSASSSLGVYWKLEKLVRKLESASGSVVGVTGAIYALRRELYPHVPEGTILDDVYIPMQLARRGNRVVFLSSAVVHDRVFPDRSREFSRKVRTLSGNYQLLRLCPWLLTPANPLLFRFVCHKLLRLVVPLLLVLMLIVAGTSSGPFFRLVFWAQIAFYAAAAVGAVNPPLARLRLFALAYTFVTLNAAATLAFFNFIIGRDVTWR